jgi:hypothetical protein
MTLPHSAWFLRRCAIPLLAALFVAGCSGGSGSSGFDAAFSENAAITQALQESRCVDRMELTICPADVSTPRGAPGGVDTGLDQAGSVGCAPATDGVCSFSLPFMPQGFPPTASFRVATRAINPADAWHMGGVPIANGIPDNADFEVPVHVPAADGSHPTVSQLQIAVLVYLNPVPANLPQVADELASFDADFAFVTQQLMTTPGVATAAVAAE